MAQDQVRLAWTRLALGDVAHAHDYIAEEKPSAAAEAVKRIHNSATMLLQYPHLGRAGRLEGTRELVVSGTPLIIVYRVKGDRIEILAVIHAARRWPETI